MTPVNKRWRNVGLYALLAFVVIALATGSSQSCYWEGYFSCSAEPKPGRAAKL